MARVEHSIALGGASLSAGAGSRLLELELGASLATPVNWCRLTLAAEGTPAAKPGDPLLVELGYDGATSQVFSGAVESCAFELGALTIEAYGGALALARLFPNALYEQQSAGAIAKDLLGAAGLSAGAVEDGLTFATYALSGQSSALAHLRDLARRCGFELYADRQDKLHFKAHAPAATHELAYGRQLLAFSGAPLSPAADGVEVYGASPAGQGQGEAASSWLSKKEVKGSAGKSAGRVLRLSDAAARTQDQAKAIAGNRLAALAATARGTATALGDPALAPGDDVRFAGLAESAFNAAFRITAVRHRLSRRRGFVSEIGWEGR